MGAGAHRQGGARSWPPGGTCVQKGHKGRPSCFEQEQPLGCWGFSTVMWATSGKPGTPGGQMSGRPTKSC